MANHAQGHTDVAAHDANHGPAVRTYVMIFVVLFVLTAIEVGASFITDIGAPLWSEILVLMALAGAKGALVVMFYMHLRFDSRWFTFLFTAAVILAIFGISVFIVLFSYHRGLVG